MSTPLWDRVKQDLRATMKASDELRTRVLRTLKSDLKYKEIELGGELTEDDCLGVIRSAAKKRRDLN